MHPQGVLLAPHSPARSVVTLVMIRMMEWTILSQQERLSLLPGSLVSTLTLIPQQSPLLLSMASFVLQQNFHHTGPLPLIHRHDVCVGEESASLADALPVSLEAPEDVDPSHRGVAPPLFLWRNGACCLFCCCALPERAHRRPPPVPVRIRFVATLWFAMLRTIKAQ